MENIKYVDGEIIKTDLQFEFNQINIPAYIRKRLESIKNDR